MFAHFYFKNSLSSIYIQPHAFKYIASTPPPYQPIYRYINKRFYKFISLQNLSSQLHIILQRENVTIQRKECSVQYV